MGIVKAVLEVESPLSEELLMKRIVWYFGRQKVTSFVRQEFEREIRRCADYGISRRKGFLYLDDGRDIRFRRQDTVERDTRRDVSDIAPEELADGMFELLKRSISCDKEGLYRDVANLCGVTRLTDSVNRAMGTAVDVLKWQGRAVVDGDRISIK